MKPRRAQHPSRRAVLGSALALTACRGRAQEPIVVGPLPPLRQVAPFPIGAAVYVQDFEDPGFVELLTAQFSQVTADWQMKMEVILKDDGGFDFSQPDAIASFAARHGLRLHGHNLIWYPYHPAAFERLQGDKAAFANAYRNYILAVAGRYRGQAVSWDVVNEPVNEDGNGYRDCLWSRVLGPNYIDIALRDAREADPSALLFINDYFMETIPAKRASFMRLAERLMKQGAPLGGLGTQTHLDIDVAPGLITACIRDLASLGLPIHISELDVSIRGKRFDFSDPATRLDKQARLVGEAVDAFMALPERQRFAITTWGVRDKDSWLRRPPNAGDGSDRPLLFDDAGRPKPAARAFVEAVSR